MWEIWREGPCRVLREQDLTSWTAHSEGPRFQGNETEGNAWLTCQGLRGHELLDFVAEASPYFNTLYIQHGGTGEIDYL